MTSVAVLGTGIMGAPMARNLARAGLQVRAWNRTPEKARALAGDGVAVCESIEDAVRGVDVALTMLADADATLAVAQRALPVLDGVWMQSGTIGLDATERCIEVAEESGVTFVDAPVLGTKGPAEKAELVVFAAGPDEGIERCAPVCQAIGRRTLRVGEAGAASRLKLAVNTWIQVATEAAGESIALAGGLGLDPRLVLEAVEGTAVDMPYLHVKGGMMLRDDFPPSFPLALAAKDARLVSEAAERAGLDLPVAHATAERFAAAVDAGLGDQDMAAVYRLSRPHRTV
jgi:3-hydroxyisobutyrate dehydrogenase